MPAMYLNLLGPVPGPSSLAVDHYSDNPSMPHTRKLKSKQFCATKRIWGLKQLCKGKRFIDTSCSAGFAVATACSLGLNALGIDRKRNNIEFAKRQYTQTQFQSIAAYHFSAINFRPSCKSTIKILAPK